MTTERWQYVKELFRSALEYEVEERAAFLERACEGDDGLRGEVESLLASFEESDHFIETFVAEAAADLFSGDQSESLVGQRLGKCEIMALLGVGGMGAVYLGRDTRLGRKVALKLLPNYFTSDSDRLRRFEQEACAASALNHPNILTIYEIGETEGSHFIATEFIEGETLRERMAGGPMKTGELLNVAEQVASALAAAHEAGIVHRDIKPENIMVRRDGIVKVLDFGLAKLLKPQATGMDATTRKVVKTNPGVVMGTVNYMSPEQARGLPVDARTDIWSLGCVLYEMVSGRVPFDRGTSSDVIAAILEREPLPLARYAPDVRTEVEWIVSKALRKDREERYQTAKELLTDLKSLKERLSFEAELERSAPPQTVAGGAATASGRQTRVETSKASTTHSSSSAEYLAGEIKRHKSASIAVLVILLLAVAGLGLSYYNNHQSKTSQIESIAVLPFQNLTGNADTEYLSDGISEALINSLTELRQLRVVARSTAFRYKGREIDPQAVGRDLNVSAVLMGRVRQTRDTLNIQVDLVDSTTGAQLWGREYERKLSDVLSVKQAIAREVMEKLSWRLSGEQQQQLVRRDTTNGEAYQHYLRGRFHWNKRTVKELQKSIEYFQMAVTVDPNYALGYAGLADAYTQFSNFGGALPREVMPKAREAALKAMSLDDRLAEAHAALGLILTIYDYDAAGAEREFKRAIELNPNYATAHHFYSRLLSAQGRHEESLAKIRRALEIEPLAIPINWYYGQALYYSRKYDESLAHLKKTLELDANFPSAHEWLSVVYRSQGNYAGSVEELAQSQELVGEYQSAAFIRKSFAKGGWQGFMRAMIKERPSDLHLLTAADFYAALGEKDKAFAELNLAYEDRSPTLFPLKVDARVDALRDDQRFQDLLQRVGY